MNDRELFKQACYAPDLKLFFADILKVKIRNEQQIREFKNKCNFSLICRRCGEKISPNDFEITFSYWITMWHPAHKDCAEIETKDNAHICQVIDASCNDCKFFKRKNEIILTLKNAKLQNVQFKTGSFAGHCLKFNRPTIGRANRCENYPCFEHRKGKAFYDK